MQSKDDGRLNCASCQFFAGKANAILPDANLGTCRRYAPTPLEKAAWSNGWEWPMVGASDWCGEYEENGGHSEQPDASGAKGGGAAAAGTRGDASARRAVKGGSQ
jgi:hypothetical protein